MVSGLIIGLIAFFITVIMTIVIVFFKARPKESEYVNYPEAINFMSRYTDGFAKGEIVDKIITPERIGLWIQPKDINWLARLKSKETVEIKPFLLWAPYSHVKVLGTGTLSGEKVQVFILPPETEDMSEELLDTPIGKALAVMIEKANAEMTAIDIIRNKEKVTNYFLKRVEGHEIFTEHAEKSKILEKDLFEKLAAYGNKSSSDNINYSSMPRNG